MSVRCRGPTGVFVISGLTASMKLSTLQNSIAEKSGVPAERQEILMGFPPRLLQVDGGSDPEVGSIGISQGDTLTVREGDAVKQAAQPQVAPSHQPADVHQPSRNGDGEMNTNGHSHQSPAQALMDDDDQLARALAASLEDSAADQPQPSTSAYPRASDRFQQPAPTSNPQHQPAQSERRHDQTSNNARGVSNTVRLPDGSAIVRRIIDSDNSCLFNAVGYVMERSRQLAKHLRQVIADTVKSQPGVYNEAFLGKTNEEYQRWIKDPKKWGGAIELSILARHFGREIAAYDINTQRVDTYGEGDGYSERAMVIYDGLHYDALAQAAFEEAPEELDVTIVENSSSQLPMIAQGAAQLVRQLNQARQFTDVSQFTLRCGVCHIGVKGQKEALEHAQATGHQNFQEYH